MKEYKYNKTSFIFQIIFFIIVVGIAEVIALKHHLWVVAFGVAVYVVICLPSLVAENKKRIIIQDETIKFSSFLLNGKPSDFVVTYKNIKSIESKVTFPKTMKLKLSVSGFEKPVFIDFNMTEHKALYSDIIKMAKEHNPNVYVESKINNYLEK